jgi:uncharacterized protein
LTIFVANSSESSYWNEIILMLPTFKPQIRFRPHVPFPLLAALLLLVFIISGCRVNSPIQPPQPAAASPGLTQPLPATPAGGGEAAQPATPAPTRTPAPAAASPTPSPSSTPTATFTPTPTLHPMNVVAARQTPFPGSEIVIEDTLERGSGYSRYIASYRSEGLKIYALLTVPDGEMPAGGWPAIVFNHGYIPPAQYRTTERYVAYVDWLARSGYIVFRSDYRGHDRSEGAARGAYGDPGYTADVLNAVGALRQFPQANPDRIGMWGHSMGGYLTLRSMVIAPDIKAGVIWAGVVVSYPDLLSRWRRQPGPTPTPVFTGGRSWRFAWTEQYGTPEENPEFWASISANAYLDDLSGPIQLHHGTADESVPHIFSEILAEEMQQAGQPVELYIYPGDNHNLSNYFSQAMNRTIQFFDAHLKNP